MDQNLYNFEGKTALITGASAGLGLHFARTLANSGARVLLAARRKDKLNSLAAEIPNAQAIQIDISDKKSITDSFSHLNASNLIIDICINNAAIGSLTPIFQEDDNDDFESIIQTNLLGTWYITKAVAQNMKRNNTPGSIINIGSINADSFPYKELTAYAISKAAVSHMSKTLVAELSEQKIRINTINLGPVQSHLAGSPNKHDMDFWLPKIPAAFMAEPTDLDGLLLYLASNNASQYVTGSTFTIDGGVSCS